MPQVQLFCRLAFVGPDGSVPIAELIGLTGALTREIMRTSFRCFVWSARAKMVGTVLWNEMASRIWTDGASPCCAVRARRFCARRNDPVGFRSQR